MEIKLLRRKIDEPVLREMRELANEIDERRLMVKEAARIIRQYLPQWRPWWKAIAKDKDELL